MPVATFDVLDGSSFHPDDNSIFDVNLRATYRQYLVQDIDPVSLNDIAHRNKDNGFTDMHFVFDVGALPKGAEITNAVLKLTADAASADAGHPTHPALISVRARDGIWNTAAGLTSTAWRGGNLDCVFSILLAPTSFRINIVGDSVGAVTSTIQMGKRLLKAFRTWACCSRVSGAKPAALNNRVRASCGVMRLFLLLNIAHSFLMHPLSHTPSLSKRQLFQRFFLPTGPNRHRRSGTLWSRGRQGRPSSGLFGIM